MGCVGAVLVVDCWIGPLDALVNGYQAVWLVGWLAG